MSKELKTEIVITRTTTQLKSDFENYADSKNSTVSQLLRDYMTKCVKQSKQ